MIRQIAPISLTLNIFTNQNKYLLIIQPEITIAGIQNMTGSLTSINISTSINMYSSKIEL
jgi:hypothetical protein